MWWAVVQGDVFNRSRIDTAVCVPLTSTLRWADAPGNELLEARMTGLPKDSVANVSQIVTLDRASLTKRVGKLPRAKLELVLFGIDVVLGALVAAEPPASADRLRRLSQPQYRLRVGEVRVFYDVTHEAVEVLAIVTKAEAAGWLAEQGTPAAPSSPG